MVVTSTVLSLFTGVWKAKDRRPQSYYRFVALSGLRGFVERTTARQQQYVFIPLNFHLPTSCLQSIYFRPYNLEVENGYKALTHEMPKTRVRLFQNSSSFLELERENMMLTQYQIATSPHLQMTLTSSFVNGGVNLQRASSSRMERERIGSVTAKPRT